MQVELNSELEEIVSDLAGGPFESPTAIIREALLRMWYDELEKRALVSAVEKGARELDAGLGIPFTPGLLEEIKQRGRALAG